MRSFILTTLAYALLVSAGRSPAFPKRRSPLPPLIKRDPTPKSDSPPIIQSSKAASFRVDGTRIPEVDFDIGESYAGLLPIGPDPDVAELYFWFFPSENPDATDEILIWLNGGPGCSSLEGLLQENGPFSWQYGTYKPVPNPYSWNKLTNVVYIDQPAGTGFSSKHSSPNVTDENQVAEQFLGWWKNFVDTFDLHHRKIFITGESYAGYYVPYIAEAMHNKTDPEYYNVDSVLIYDPSATFGVVQQDAPALPFVEYWSHLFNLNETFMNDLRARHEKCGYKTFLQDVMVFPPKGLLPSPPDVNADDPKCRLWSDIYDAAQLVNPCWNTYQVATTCPVLWDVLGFPGSFSYIPTGAEIYFNRKDVQKAINAPAGDWKECSDGVLDTDNSDFPGLSVIPRIVEKNQKTIIVHGLLDYYFLSNGTIIMIQNMTWNGGQGFSRDPSSWHDLYVPYHVDPSPASLAGAGIMGQWYEERGLTFSTVSLSGHMVPQFAPSAAYRQVEYMLGRIGSLGEVSDFTTQKGNSANRNSTVEML